MPDHMDVENAAVTQRFIDRQREYAEQQKRPRRPIAAPAVIERPVIYGDEAAHLLAESAHTEQRMIALVQARSRERQAAEAEAQANAVQAPELDPSRTDAELRAGLQSTIEAHDNAMVKVGTAEASLARARQRVAEADAELRNYADLDQRIVEWHTTQIRNDANGEPPASLAEEVRQRAVVVDRIDATHKAADRLRVELNEAHRELDRCRAIRAYAAAHIISAYADQIAASLDAAMNRCEELKRQLLSASSFWLTTSNGATSLPLSPRARVAVHRQMLDVAPVNAYTEAMRDWHRRLENNPQALLAE